MILQNVFTMFVDFENYLPEHMAKQLVSTKIISCTSKFTPMLSQWGKCFKIVKETLTRSFSKIKVLVQALLNILFLEKELFIGL